MRSLGEWASERVSAAEMNVIWIVFAILAVALTVGCYWYMHAKMRPAVGDEPEAAPPAPAPSGAPKGSPPSGGSGTTPAGTATRRWIYKTDESGRPRRFLSHREAAWWAALTTGKITGPFFLFFLFSAARVAFGPETPGGWAIALVVTGGVLIWLLTAGAVYLYVALSGGVMDRAERHAERQGRR